MAWYELVLSASFSISHYSHAINNIIFCLSRFFANVLPHRSIIQRHPAACAVLNSSIFFTAHWTVCHKERSLAAISFFIQKCSKYQLWKVEGSDQHSMLTRLFLVMLLLINAFFSLQKIFAIFRARCWYLEVQVTIWGDVTSYRNPSINGVFCNWRLMIEHIEKSICYNVYWKVWNGVIY